MMEHVQELSLTKSEAHVIHLAIMSALQDPSVLPPVSPRQPALRPMIILLFLVSTTLTALEVFVGVHRAESLSARPMRLMMLLESPICLLWSPVW